MTARRAPEYGHLPLGVRVAAFIVAMLVMVFLGAALAGVILLAIYNP